MRIIFSLHSCQHVTVFWITAILVSIKRYFTVALIYISDIYIRDLCLYSVQFSCSVVSDSLRPHELQHARPPCPSSTPRVYSNSSPLSRWCHPASHHLLSPSSPTFNLSQHQGLFKRVSSSHQVAKVLKFQLQHQSFWWIFRIDFL